MNQKRKFNATLDMNNLPIDDLENFHHISITYNHDHLRRPLDHFYEQVRDTKTSQNYFMVLNPNGRLSKHHSTNEYRVMKESRSLEEDLEFKEKIRKFLSGKNTIINHHRDGFHPSFKTRDALQIENEENSFKFPPILQPRIEEIHSKGLLKLKFIEYIQSIISEDEVISKNMYSLIQKEANSFGNAIQRMCYYFLDALTSRMEGNGFQRFRDPPAGTPQELGYAMNEVFSTLPHVPYCVKALTDVFFDALGNQKKVHVIELGMTQTNQIPHLMKMLASNSYNQLNVERFSHFRYTSVTNGDTCNEEYEMELATLARNLGIEFEFRHMQLPLERLKVNMLNLREEEAIAVCCCLELHHLMDDSVFRFNPRDAVIQMIKKINAKVVCIVEMDVDFNGIFFIERFKECLDYHFTAFDYHDALFPRDNKSRLLLEKQIMGKTITNVIACEGSNRKIRTENLEKWSGRMLKARFSPYPFSSLMNQNLNHLLKAFPRGFASHLIDGAVRLTWKGQNTVFLSAWH